jgi:ribonuclease Z
MSKFSVLILGSACATPTLNRNPTAQLVNINHQYFLIDCGEGTQLQLRKYNINFNRINHIFISHLHGDHYLGLMGLLQTMHLLGREKELFVYGPEGLKTILDTHFKYSKSFLKYPLQFKAVNMEQSSTIFENEKLIVNTVILKHKIPCTGFVFKEKPKPRRINPKAIEKYKVPKYAINKLKSGIDFESSAGEIIKNNLLTHDSLPSYSYAFCSDTAYFEDILPEINNVSLLYHESTFLEKDKKLANKTLHSTAKEAASIAQQAKANKLIIGHFSNRYSQLTDLLEEAKSVFENTDLALEGKEFNIAESQ